jgi:lipopolysaccharide/colanic/teichoic acid biosynthesis glycosyltransferase
MSVVSGSSAALSRKISTTSRGAGRRPASPSVNGTPPLTSPTAATPPHPEIAVVRATGGATALPLRKTTRPRAVVIDLHPAPGPDRLDSELDVRVRVRPPTSSQQLARLLAKHRPRLLLCKHSLESIAASFLAVCAAYDVEVYMLADPVYGVFKPVRVWRFGGLPWLQVRRRRSLISGERLKRGIDLTLIVLSAPVWLPLMVLIGLAVALDGPPLYFQDRVGAGGRPFRMVKFRSMRPDAEADTGPIFAATDDARLTRVGALLRRLRLDELPQIWNVLCGHMSLVGPRPERPEFVAELRKLPDYELRHLIRPGLTGIAQLTGGYAATPEEKLRCDLLYLNGRTVRSDLMLLALTVFELFRGFPRG